MCSRVSLAICATLLFPPVGAAHENLSPEQMKFFEEHVRPLLVQQCVKCHGEKKQKGELRLDSRAAMLEGGESGAAIEPGMPEDSLLVEAIRHESLEMPPDEKLVDKSIDAMVKWIKMGAPWPQHSGKDVVLREASRTITAKDRKWWAIQPLKKPAVPWTKDDRWSRTDMDRFVLARMRQAGLAPAAEADRATLIRRVFFDLLGLPPTPKEVDAFVTDPSPQAYERLVDSLLTRPEYGQRWARHWLDLVRYADSDGYRIDHYRKEAWRYRDYVVEAFNNDKPYDRFVQEQIAGDELFPGNSEALIATGFLRAGIYEYNNRDVRGQWKAILEDVTDTTGDVFLGVGMQCAKCHDHKFDPILQKDYYRLQAFFAPILWRDDLVAMPDSQRSPQDARRLAEWESKTAAIREEIAQLESRYRKQAAMEATIKFPEDIQVMMRKPVADRTTFEHQLAELAAKQIDFEYTRLDSRIKGSDKDRILALRKQLSTFDHLRPRPLPKVMAISDARAEPPETKIPGGSDASIEPGFLTILDPEAARIENPRGLTASTGRRTTLARWLTRPDNPLTTRVIVNRIWQYHFGKGLAVNGSDLGVLGGAPSHPQLLDWLATRFVRDGWSFKKLHRTILTSATYRQATSHPNFAQLQQIDPTNKYYWRGSTRRLDAEQIRDAMLAVSGQLELDQHGGPGVNGDTPRRSVYLRYMRNAREPLLDVFDLPQFFASESSRSTTTTPVQSLLLINSQQMLRHASRFADRVAAKATTRTEQVNVAWKLAYGRLPTEAEQETALRFLKLETKADAPLAAATTEVLTGKIPYRDGQAIAFEPDGRQHRLAAAHDKVFDGSDFTVEAYFQIRSVYETGAVRAIVAKGSGDPTKPNWIFGVTGRGSRRKPQTLVLQMFGTRDDDTFGEAALFSDQHIEINTPYFAAASVRFADGQAGSVTFYLKDLSNDDEPLQTARIEHNMARGVVNRDPLTVGARSGAKRPSYFHGLIDEIRLTDRAVAEEKLLFTAEEAPDGTLAYWRFEGDPGIFRDSTKNGRHLTPFRASGSAKKPKDSALVDFCHALLNSSEFLYVD